MKPGSQEYSAIDPTVLPVMFTLPLPGLDSWGHRISEANESKSRHQTRGMGGDTTGAFIARYVCV